MRKSVAFSVTLMFTTATSAISQTCSLPSDVLAANKNGSLLTRTNGRWTPFDGFEALTGRTSLSFAFIVKEEFAPSRTGVVAIKTATLLRARNAWKPSTVRLVRNESSNDSCSSQAFKGGSVPARAYEDYHGKGRTESRALDAVDDEWMISNSKVIQQFHSGYSATASARCRRSDAIDYIGFEYRNNRSQFSFDTRVVDSGWSYAFTNVLSSLAPEAIGAALPKLANQRTEIRHYSISSATPTCIRFDLDASGPDQVLRVNDVESRSGMSRDYEKRWPAQVD